MVALLQPHNVATEALSSRLDSFPYRHRLQEVMSSPPALAAETLSLVDAARRMRDDGISSLLIDRPERPGVPVGILTERDVLNTLADLGPNGMALAIGNIMSEPVESLPVDAMVYQALGRMSRLGLRHLAVLGGDGRAVGVISARDLLKQRVSQALALGDGMAVAADTAALGRQKAALPGLAADLLSDRTDPLDIAAVISEEMRLMTGRAAELAEAAVAADGLGAPPAPYCVLTLGSAGRGESLLAGDQDNALVHAGTGADDPWYAALGAHMCRILDAAGLPRCRGGVMASETRWRHTLKGWHQAIGGWIAEGDPQHLLSVDIFFDFQPVWGDRSLAEELRRAALEMAAGASPFLSALAAQVADFRPPLGLFGSLRTQVNGDGHNTGRVDLKLGGLFPLVAGARTLAIRRQIACTGTQARFVALAEAGHLNARDLDSVRSSHAFIVELLLRQQIADIEDGTPAGNGVEVRRLTPQQRGRLKHRLRRLDTIPSMVRDGLTL